MFFAWNHCSSYSSSTPHHTSLQQQKQLRVRSDAPVQDCPCLATENGVS